MLVATDIQPAGIGQGTYSWTTSSQRLRVEAPSTGHVVTVRAGPVPNAAPEIGEVVEVTRTQPGCAPITRHVLIWIQKCKLFRLAQERIIAIATDPALRSTTPTATVPDPLLPGGHALSFGQDISFSTGRAQPHGPSVGSTTAVLEPKMRELLSWFASNDTHGKARRLFKAFLVPQTAVSFWSDPHLTAAAETHPNITSFVHRALSAPNSPERAAGGTRIHQALETAGWDINAAVAPTDLGVPAFNRGSDILLTEDYSNGLTVMVDGVQHVIVVAKDYHYDRCAREYYIRLEYVFYDVFGLDDIDLRRFGADGWPDTIPAEGFTAWWQLQHQHGYAPLITRIAFEREFRVPVP
ncbi:hypothetical protein sce4667 [Sorangium cellulosum So ce56]|uniref:Uncharacterized protein n=1 Tax=Sorangium cellulosum (strain So ce56) TaxID=448385 RepID=A9FDY2_SORC5|nr:hypothetical protein sce4667 [Sorangium cellulosum So ce56]